MVGATLIDGDDSDNTSAADSNAAHEEDFRTMIGVRSYPIDASAVARAQPGTPFAGAILAHHPLEVLVVAAVTTGERGMIGNTRGKWGM